MIFGAVKDDCDIRALTSREGTISIAQAAEQLGESEEKFSF